MEFLLLGFFTGLSLILAVGAQNIFVIEQGLKKQYVFLVCIICSLSDLLLIFLGILLFHFFHQHFNLFIELTLNILLIIFLIFFVFSKIKSIKRNISFDSEVKDTSKINISLKTLGFTYLNAHVYSDTVFFLGNFSKNFLLDEKIYFEIIRKKTASLISSCCALGASASGVSKDKINQLADFGEKIGIAFQLKDDLFDLMGSENDTGKNSGGDVKKNMKTLPLIYSMSNMKGADKRRLKKLLKSKRKNNSILSEIHKIIEDTGGVDYAIGKLDEYSNRALTSISTYPDTIYKTALINLVNFNKSRVK